MSKLKATLLVLCVAAISREAGHAQSNRTTWTDYGGSPDNARYLTLNQITRSNVDQLRVAWTYPSSDNISYVFNPIIVDNVMFVLARNNSLVAIDATTGKEIWIHEGLQGIAPRGINYWESSDRSDRRLLYLNAGSLTAIDARTGASIPSFGDTGRVDVRIGLHRDLTNIRRLQTNNPGRLYQDLFIVSLPAGGAGYVASPGDIHAYDVRSGKLMWVFHTVPERGEPGAETWPEAALETGSGVHNWSSGNPLNFTMGTDGALDGTGGAGRQLAQLASGKSVDDITRDHSSREDMVNAFFNTSAFAPVASLPRGCQVEIDAVMYLGK